MNKEFIFCKFIKSKFTITTYTGLLIPLYEFKHFFKNPTLCEVKDRFSTFFEFFLNHKIGLAKLIITESLAFFI